MMRKSMLWLWVPSYFKARNFNNKRHHIKVKSKNNKQNEKRESYASKITSTCKVTEQSINDHHHNIINSTITSAGSNNLQRKELHYRANAEEHVKKSKEMNREMQSSEQENVPLSVSKRRQDLCLLVCKAHILLHALRADNIQSMTELGSNYFSMPSLQVDCGKQIMEWEQNLFNSVQSLRFAEKLAFIALTAQREVFSQLMHVFVSEKREHNIELSQSKMEMSEGRFVVIPDEKLEKLNSNENNNVMSFLHTESNESKERQQKEQISEILPTSPDFALSSASKPQEAHCVVEVDKHNAKSSLFALDELVIFLKLYEKVKCEDGKLLQFLLDEVDKFLYSFVAHTNKSTLNFKYKQKIRVEVINRDNEKKLAESDKFKSLTQNQVELASTKITKLPLPELLLVLSQLGIIQESTLQLLTFYGKREGFQKWKISDAENVKNTNNKKKNNDIISNYSNDKITLTTVKDHNGKGILFYQLALYDVNELIMLLVALQHFKMHDEYIFTKVISTIHNKLKRERQLSNYMRISKSVISKLITINVKLNSHLTSFEENIELHNGQVETSMEENADWLKSTRLSKQQQRAYTKYGKHALTVAEIFHQLPRVHSSDVLSIELLLDALKSLFYSEYKNKEVVLFIGNLIAQQALLELDKALTTVSSSTSSSSSLISEPRELNREWCLHETDRAKEHCKPLVYIAKQVLGASRLCEEIQIENALLRIMLMWCTTLTKRGVVVDGGEDAELTSESRAYYDHVTADLIKIRFVKE